MAIRRSLLLLLLAVPGTPPAPTAVMGTVADDRGAVAAAVVRVPATPLAARTDERGHFTLPGRPARVTVSADGRIIAAATVPAVRVVAVTLTRIPDDDCETYAWVDPGPDANRPGSCCNCHTPACDEWARSGHARAATNPRLRNLYDGTDAAGRPGRGWNLLAEHPAGAGVCAACHAPTADPDAASDYDLRRVTGRPSSAGYPAAGGVHCDYCHKAAGLGDGEIGLTHGRYLLRLSRPAAGQRFFGPLDDVDRGEDVASPFQHDSRLCAACHEGTVFGVHAYGTYSEWRASPAAARGVQCQDCHMPAGPAHTNVAPAHGGRERSHRTLADHSMFPGGRAAMLRRCLALTVEPARDGRGVAVAVTVRADGVGHRVPTGFPDRNLVLAVEALDAAGRPVVATAGPTLPPATGPELAGRSGRLFAKQLRDFDGRQPAPFWRSDPEFADTRLRPGEPDRTAYRFPPSAARVRVRLLDRRFWPEVAAVKGWVDNERIVADRDVPVP